MPSKKGRAPTRGAFKKGDDPRRSMAGQISKPVLQFRRAIRQLLVDEGNKLHSVKNQAGETVTLSKIEWVVVAAYNAAVTGDAKARDFIVERVEGKVAQPLALDNMSEEQRNEYVRGLLAQSGWTLEEPEGEGLQDQADNGSDKPGMAIESQT